MSAPRVLGIDPSPTSSGITFPDGSTGVWKDPGLVAAGHDTGSRLCKLFDLAEQLFASTSPDLVVLEGYNNGLKKFGRVFQIGEVGGIFKLAAARAGLIIVVVTPSARSEFGCGKGNQSKKIVMTAWEAITGRDFSTSDECDAHILREMGLWILGRGSVSHLPFSHLKALTKVKEGQRELIEQAKRKTQS